MAQLIEFPIKAATRAGNALVQPLRSAWPVHSVDDYGRDPHLISALAPLAKLRWDVTVGGEQHLPVRTGALLVCNHVSYMDALILSASIPRPARFVMYYKIFNIPVMRWIFRTAKAIPIAGARENPELMQRAFDEVDAVLAEGELVCIFPEGALTKDGDIAPFKSGVERILQRAAAVA